jgi:hypothetical protein
LFTFIPLYDRQFLMKPLFNLLFFLLYTGLIFSQQNKKHKQNVIAPIHTFNLEFFVNKDNNSNGEGVIFDSFQGQGMNVELNSFYGIVFFRKLSLSTGLGVVFNFRDNLKALPLAAQLKWHFKDYNKEGAFILLNTGLNIALGNFKKGQTGKFALGYAFKTRHHSNYEISGIFKFKNYILNNNTNIQRNSVGISFGIQFN